MAGHTPGPWSFDPTDSEFIRAADGQAVGQVSYNRPGDEVAANGLLWAAAPDLLAACEALHARLFREHGGQENSPWAAPLAVLSKAIAKAKGDSR